MSIWAFLSKKLRMMRMTPRSTLFLPWASAKWTPMDEVRWPEITRVMTHIWSTIISTLRLCIGSSSEFECVLSFDQFAPTIFFMFFLQRLQYQTQRGSFTSASEILGLKNRSITIRGKARSTKAPDSAGYQDRRSKNFLTIILLCINATIRAQTQLLNIVH